MSLAEEIKKAIGAHGMWKMRLQSAIDTAKSEFTAENVCRDNQCDFGRWLYRAEIPAAEKSGPHYEKVRCLHAEFHKKAAEVLKVAVTGKKEEAKNLMATNSPFAVVSGQLTFAMIGLMSK